MLLTATGCSSHSQVIIKNRECSVPARVELTALDKNAHIGSEKNVAVLMINIADLVAYIKSLEASIRCFKSSDPSAYPACANSDSSLLGQEFGSPRKNRSPQNDKGF